MVGVTTWIDLAEEQYPLSISRNLGMQNGEAAGDNRNLLAGRDVKAFDMAECDRGVGGNFVVDVDDVAMRAQRQRWHDSGACGSIGRAARRECRLESVNCATSTRT